MSTVEQPAVHVKWGPTWVASTTHDDRPTRWCFACRKHVPHYWQLMEDGPECQPSYYDPRASIRCMRCDRDCTAFPDGWRDGPAYPSEDVWQRLVNTATWAWDVAGRPVPEPYEAHPASTTPEAT